ncbi:dihydrofolate reductase [Lachnoanaerobaculum saburreum F0468]|jgi:Dihydrofolate reductase|uniref:dihydrofolate reductase n=1 Tax=Lachnoanaerobaculum saburreum F0468 TaxID=1095750 RepID=I0R5P4_9FIRM|nr:dihydrofolate reductase [Lachnoanaerobaculum saburreum]EIC95002.1 dihydrofolate reductase [Lachnoanaerobaculum saburreum F0468]
MNIIVSVDKRWGIGNKGKLLVSIPRDKKLFREETTGKVIIMGHNTLLSLPGAKPLAGRKNIVLSKDKSLTVKGATVLNSVDTCLDYIKKNNIDDNDVFVIGGESVYNDFLPYCNIAHITYIDYEYEADRHFLNMEKDENWDLILETEEETYFDIPYTFRLYKRNNRL